MKLLSLICCILLSSTIHGRRVFANKKRMDAGPPFLSNVEIFAESLTKITGKLHSRAVEDAAANGVDNVVISPFSISVSLGMTLLGAEENTASEIERFTLWQWEEDEMDIHNIMRKQIKKITDPSKGSQVNMSNAMFLEDTFAVSPEYKTTIIDNYLAEHQSLDFSNAPDNATTDINDWIEKASGIEKMIPDGTITSLTKMVLVNVVNFLGKWNVPFESETETLPFKPEFSDASAIEVEYLVKEELPILVYQNPTLPRGIQALFFAIPYKAKGDNAPSSYMLIGKPDSARDLALINQHLGLVLADLKPIEKGWGGSGWNEYNVNVKLPKFDVSQELDIKKVLKKERIMDLFDLNNCDLSGITGGLQNGLYVSDFLHKAKVQIDAEGTEASAAAMQVVSFRSIRFPPPPITVDVPFFFGIYNRKVNTFVFTGVVNNPNSN